MDELLRMPDESDRLRAQRDEYMCQELIENLKATVRVHIAQRLRCIFASAREDHCRLKEPRLSFFTQRFPTVHSLVLESYDVDDTAFDWSAHLDVLERALEADLLASSQKS
jgi:hypothetical protein